MTTDTDLPQLPFDRPDVFDIGPGLTALRERHPVSRIRTPAGHPAWLVTGYAETRQLFADDRLGRTHPHPERAARISAGGFTDGPLGDDPAVEQADHERLRRLLVPAFSARRMRLLEADMRALVDGLLDTMVAAGTDGTPVDLQEHLTAPLPIHVISTLLGVPHADRAHFREASERVVMMQGGEQAAARAELFTYTKGLAGIKRRQPGEDVVSDLVAAQSDDPTFDDGKVARMAAGLLFAGHETTLQRLTIGALMLLDNPRARAAIVDPALAARVVDEVIRLAAPMPGGLSTVNKYAQTDITVGEGPRAVTIAAGDLVMLNTFAANRDPSAIPDAETFDPGRIPNPHLSFGHGGHFCLGASLARTELRVGLGALFTRLPGLRLAVSPDQLRLHTDRTTGGLHELPVTW